MPLRVDNIELRIEIWSGVSVDVGGPLYLSVGYTSAAVVFVVGGLEGLVVVRFRSWAFSSSFSCFNFLHSVSVERDDMIGLV